MSYQMNIGSVRSHVGELKVSLAVDESGLGEVRLFASDPTDLRKAGVLLNLNESGLRELDDLLEKVRTVVLTLKGDGRLKALW